MKITLYPQYRPGETLDVVRSGDVLVIDGETFDFSGVIEGSTLPWEALGTEKLCGPVERINGTLHLGIRVPFGDDEITTFHTWAETIMEVTVDGPVELPR